MEGIKGLKRPGSLISTRNCTYFIRMVSPPKNPHNTLEGVLDACLTEGISNQDRLEAQRPSDERTTVGAYLLLHLEAERSTLVNIFLKWVKVFCLFY